MSYQRWIGPNEWGESIPIPQHKGSFERGVPNVYRGNLKTDHGGKAYKDIDCDLKTSEKAVAENMPLLSEYANYGERETDSERRAMTLYNRPISLGVDYFVRN